MFAKHVNQRIIECYRMRGTKGRFGIELEWEGEFAWPQGDNVLGWQAHADGSIRGMEYVTSVPHDLEGVGHQMRYLNGVMENFHIVPRMTHRGSTHIHYNVQRETWLHVLGLIILFTAIEPVFLRICGAERDGNLFCLPSYDSSDVHLHFERLLEHITALDARGYPPRGKYASMNINPIPHQGSVEFRTFPATAMVDQVVGWCQLIDSLMRWVKDQKDITYREMLLQIKQNPDVVNKILDRDCVFFCKPYAIQDLILQGIMNAHELRRLLSMYMKGYVKPEEDF